MGDAHRVPPKTEGQSQQQETEDQRISPFMTSCLVAGRMPVAVRATSHALS